MLEWIMHWVLFVPKCDKVKVTIKEPTLLLISKALCEGNKKAISALEVEAKNILI